MFIMQYSDNVFIHFWIVCRESWLASLSKIRFWYSSSFHLWISAFSCMFHTSLFGCVVVGHSPRGGSFQHHKLIALRAYLPRAVVEWKGDGPRILLVEISSSWGLWNFILLFIVLPHRLWDRQTLLKKSIVIQVYICILLIIC